MKKFGALLITTVASVWIAPAVQAQEEPAAGGDAVAAAAAKDSPEETTEQSGKDAGDIVVTATKNASGLTVQNAPLAITAFGPVQLAEMNVKSISDLSVGVPNANLQSNAAQPGFNYFSIRGLAVYATIPSTTPTVGVFVDEIYQGSPAGAGWQQFDLAGIEILRGPQGLFFGRNVTGGAILVRTSDPTDELSGHFEAGVESGPDYTLSGVVSGPLSSTIKAKIGAYWNKDEGYFSNNVVGRDVGKNRTLILRGALTFEPSSDFKSTFRIDRNDLEGDGTVAKNRLATGIKKFEVTQNDPGFIDSVVWQASNRTDINVDLGDGVITNILGWRKIHVTGLSDIDSTPVTAFHLLTGTRQEQWSDELRYSGSFGIVDLTMGVFYYKDKIGYLEDRTLAQGALRRGGGRQHSETFAEFANIDVHVTPTLTLNLGQRWSTETKRADIEPLTPTATSPCSVTTEDCTTYRFSGNKDRWNAFTPRLGFQWKPADDVNVYGFYTKGYRSGGFNLRNTGGAVQAYGQEVANAFEVGVKSRFADNRVRTALALFNTKFSDLQRDVLVADLVLGSTQTTANTADVRIRGIEAEASADVGSGFTLSGSLGYLDSKFLKVLYDLSGNGTVGPEDFRLRLPYLSKWSYGARVNYRDTVGPGTLSAMLSFSYRSDMAHDDRNSRIIDPVKRLDATLAYAVGDDEEVIFSVYGKNLLNRIEYTNEAPLQFATGGGAILQTVFSPMSKGRILGAKVDYRF